MTASLVGWVRAELAALDPERSSDDGLAIIGAAIAAGQPPSEAWLERWREHVRRVAEQPRYSVELVRAAEILCRPDERQDELLGVLELRTGIERTRLALDAIAPGCDLHDDDLVALAEVDRLLEETLWWFTALNAERSRLALAIDTGYHHRFTWLFRGLDVDVGAVESLAAVASLLARFPSARETLDELVEVERALHEPGVSADPGRATYADPLAGAPVLDLAAARKKRDGRILSLVAGVRVAAAGQHELRDPHATAPIVHEDDAVEVRVEALPTGMALRIIVWGDDCQGLEERGAVRCFDASGAEVRPVEGQALPTLWWGRFEATTPVRVQLASPARDLVL